MWSKSYQRPTRCNKMPSKPFPLKITNCVKILCKKTKCTSLSWTNKTQNSKLVDINKNWNIFFPSGEKKLWERQVLDFYERADMIIETKYLYKLYVLQKYKNKMKNGLVLTAFRTLPLQGSETLMMSIYLIRKIEIYYYLFRNLLHRFGSGKGK